jgi:hypothetical protein
MRLLTVALPLIAACVMPPQGAALMQQTAQEFNLNMRFGRMELAVEQVAPKYEAEFMKQHHAWGAAVHIADAETIGMRAHGVENYDVSVRVGWYRVDEGYLHTTTVKQHWHLYKRGWLLDNEQRMDGDIGVLGENVEVLTPDTPQRSAQFPTLRLGTD